MTSTVRAAVDVRFTEAIRDAQRFGSATSRAMRQASFATQRFAASTRALDVRFSSATRALVNFRSAIFGLAVVTAGSSGLSAVRSMEKANIVFLKVFGSAEAAAEQMRFVEGVAERLAIRTDIAADSFAKLAASAEGTKIPISELRTLFVGVSQEAKSLGLRKDEIRGVFRAIEQIISKGSVQAEEIRGQLGERLPGAFNKVAASLGLTTKQLSKALSLGLVNAEIFVKRFGKSIARDSKEGADIAIDSWIGMEQTLGFLTFKTRLAFGEGLVPAYTAALKDMARVIGAPEFQSGVRNFGEFVGNTLGFLVRNASAIKSIVVALIALRVAIKAAALAGAGLQFLSRVTGGIGGGIADSVGGALLQRGSSPANPLFVADVSGGKFGRAGKLAKGAAGVGAGAAGAAGVSAGSALAVVGALGGLAVVASVGQQKADKMFDKRIRSQGGDTERRSLPGSNLYGFDYADIKEQNVKITLEDKTGKVEVGDVNVENTNFHRHVDLGHLQ